MQSFTLNITCPVINVTGTTTHNLIFNTAMTPATYSQTGGNPAIIWSVSRQPANLTINSSTGQLTGTPAVTGVFNAVITATDVGGCTDALAVTINVGPSIQNQNYSGVGNTQLFITGVSGAPSTPAVTSAAVLLTGATPGDVAVTMAGCTAGGALSGVDALGRFILTPDVGATSAICTYTVSSNTGSGSGSVGPATTTANLTFTLNDQVWYVDNSFAGTSDGRSHAPFKRLDNGASGLGSSAGTDDYIYVHKGSSPGTPTPGAYALLTNQKLIGAGATLSVGGILSVAGNSANTPTLSSTLSASGATGLTVNGLSMSTGSAIAVNLVNSDGSFTFQSISAVGGTNGIIWNNSTQATGSFTVTGGGGTCTGADQGDCSGGTLASMTGADNSTATPPGTGIVLNGASNVSLTRMWLHDHSNYAVRGTSVNGFTLANSVINGTNGTNGATPFNDGSVTLKELTGSATISNTSMQGGFSDNFRVMNTSGTLDRITFDNVTFDISGTTPNNDALTLESSGTAVLKVTVQNSSSRALRAISSSSIRSRTTTEPRISSSPEHSHK